MKLHKVFWLVPFMLLCSCASINNKNQEKEDLEAREVIEEAMGNIPIEVAPYDEELVSLELLDEVECPSSESLVKFHEGEQDQYITVIDKNIPEAEAPYQAVGDYTPTKDDVLLVDENDNEIPLTVINSANGQTDFKIPVSDFEEEHGYHLKIVNNNVKFAQKDESIRQITYYSLEVNDNNRRNLASKNNNIKSFDINKVDYFDTDAYGAYFIYQEPFDIDGSVIDETGMKFRVANLDKYEDDQETTYGKLISNQKNPNGEGYIIRYEPCKGEDLFTALDINDSIVVNEETCENMVFYNDEETVEQGLARAFLTHPDIITTMSGIMNHYNVKLENFQKSILDWASMVQVKFNIGYDSTNNVFNIGFNISLTFNPESNITVTLSLEYKRTTRYSVEASLSIETWLFVPVGVNYKLKVTEDESNDVKFGLLISSNMAPYDEEKVKDGIVDDVLTAFTKNNDIKSKFNGDGGTATPDGKTYPLFRFDCYYFWPLDIRFEIDFYWKLQLTVEAFIKYSSHTQKIDVSMSNSKGCDPHSETKSVKDQNLTFQYIGTLHAEIGFKVSLGIGISGFYRFFHAAIYITAYGALDAQGYLVMGVAWNEGQDATFAGSTGGKFEISVGVKWGVEIVLLFGGFNFEWPIAKVVLVGFADDGVINSFVSDEATVEITDQDYGHAINLDDYHLLGVNVFDSKNFTPTTRDMKHDDGAKVRYGEWVSEEYEKYFTFELTKGADYVTFDDYKLNIKSIYGITEFDAEIKVTVHPRHCFSLTDIKVTKTIKVHFTNNRKQQISVIDINGQTSNIGSYVVGTSTKLPVPNAPRYMRFVGWKNLTTNQVISYVESDPNTGTYQIPDTTNPVTFEYLFEDYYSWKVVWVDGFGNIIRTDQVMNGEDAVPPSPEERDQYMISYDPNYQYVFTGYDVSYQNITANTVIRAQYTLERI